MKGETEEASVDSWNSGRPDVHCTLIFRSRNSPLGLKDLVAMREPVRFFAGRQVCGETDSDILRNEEKCTFAKNLSKQVKGMRLKELSSLKWC